MSSRTALVFPGQGSQRLGMFESVPGVEKLPRLLDAAEALSGLDLRTVSLLGPESELSETRISQPLLYLADWAWGSSLVSSGVTPFAVAGHSLGELAALAVAGVFSVEAGLELVIERSKLMSEAAMLSPGTMAAVLGMDAAAIGAAIQHLDGVWIANDNAPGQIVLSGPIDGVIAASDAVMAAGARKVVPLKVAGAFHSPLMESARAGFERILRGAEFQNALYPVLQNTDPTPAVDGQLIRDRLIGQITAPVRWTETMHALSADGPITMVESGPGAVLTGLGKRVEGVTALAAEAMGIESVLLEVS